jgi:hypothetical protein
MSAGSPHATHDEQLIQIAKYIKIKMNLVSAKM